MNKDIILLKLGLFFVISVLAFVVLILFFHKTPLVSLVFVIAFFLGLCVYLYKIFVNKANDKEIKNAYEELLSIMDDYVIMTQTDKRGIITYATNAFCVISGYSKQELIGKPQNIIRHPDTPKEVFKQMWKQIQAGKRWSGELKNKDKNGNPYWVKGNIIPKLNTAGLIKGYVAIRVDLSDKIALDTLNTKLKNEITHKIKELGDKDKYMLQHSKMAVLGEMMDAVAHQWKQPLSIMSLYAMDISQSVAYNEMNQEYADTLRDKIQAQIKHLSTTLNEFRNFFRDDKSIDKFCLYQNIQDILMLVEDDLKKHTINIQVTGSKDVYAFGIANEFKHVILNLITNSKDAFEEAHIKQRFIAIEIQSNKQYAKVIYRDNAGGIPENIIDKIFEPNFTTKSFGKGSGVGLYLSKMIIQKIGAKISVQNCENGVEFVIQLPQKDRRVQR